MADEIIYPIQKFHFQVDWGDITINCSEVSGLNSTMEPINYCDAKSRWVTAQPGLQKFDDIVFTKAIFEEDKDYQEWHQRVEDREDPYRETVTVTLKNELHEPVFIWTLENTYVTKWETPDMNSTANEVAIEKITVVCENIVTEIGE